MLPFTSAKAFPFVALSLQRWTRSTISTKGGSVSAPARHEIRGDALAVFQEMSSRPTTIVALNVAIAYGMISGHKCTTVDAVKAYAQSDLKSKHPTYIEIPKYLCPPAWRKMDKPVVQLKKALYGHPEAGGHWERHLEAIIKTMGGKPIPNHPSCFWFEDKKLLMIVYVDDLLLSGPEDLHADLWKELRKKVTLEPPEDLDRYLGRHHIFQPFKRLPYDLLEHFVSPVEV